MISAYNNDYPEIEQDYYYRLGYADAVKGKMYWSTLAFTAGFLLSYELIKEFLKTT
jgi:hypothetical protein